MAKGVLHAPVVLAVGLSNLQQQLDKKSVGQLFAYPPRPIATAGRHRFKNTAPNPQAHIQVVRVPVVASEDGNEHKHAGVVSLAQSRVLRICRNMVSAGFLRETATGCDTHFCRQSLQVVL